jgi:hypothetical protein
MCDSRNCSSKKARNPAPNESAIPCLLRLARAPGSRVCSDGISQKLTPFFVNSEKRPINDAPAETGNSHVFRYPVLRTELPYVLADCALGLREHSKRCEIGARIRTFLGRVRMRSSGLGVCCHSNATGRQQREFTPPRATARSSGPFYFLFLKREDARARSALQVPLPGLRFRRRYSAEPRATRNPRKPPRFPGEIPSRCAARQTRPGLNQQPPRCTRRRSPEELAGSDAGEFLVFDFLSVSFGGREGSAGSDSGECR